jgi:Tfp pilus assembly protein PilN
MIEINLLPTQLRLRSHPTAKKTPTLAPVPRAFPLSLVGLTLLMAIFVLVSGTRVGASQRKSQQVQSELEHAQEQAAEAERVTAGFPETAARYRVLASRLDGKTPWADVLRVISLRCPSDVRITSLVLERHRRTGEPLKLVISGTYAGTASLEMNFAKALKESATCADVFESVIPEKELMPDGQTNFGISCLIRPFMDELVDAPDEAAHQ